jgi:hypothetical protein
MGWKIDSTFTFERTFSSNLSQVIVKGISRMHRPLRWRYSRLFKLKAEVSINGRRLREFIITQTERKCRQLYRMGIIEESI